MLNQRQCLLSAKYYHLQSAPNKNLQTCKSTWEKCLSFKTTITWC
ncbi:MAG: hypothetical protein E6J34_04325 [Chloroflexi bacterium]|nr:MAG: hypothetical protein E6J34_04325 [Chloroflexota bacterium]